MPKKKKKTEEKNVPDDTIVSTEETDVESVESEIIPEEKEPEVSEWVKKTEQLMKKGFIPLRMTNKDFNLQIWHPANTNFYHWVVNFFADLEHLTYNNETISKNELKGLQEKYNILIQKK